MPETTENHDLITTAQEAVEPHELTDGRWLVRDSDGRARVIDLTKEIEAGQPNPNRKTGARTVTDAASFAAYLAKHGVTETEVWGNRDQGTIKAVINAHESAESGEGLDTNGVAGWGDHTITLQLRHSDDWKEWTKANGAWMPKDQFAEFIEDHLPNFGTPTGAEMLELARSFKATVNVEFGNTEHAGGKTTVAYTKTTEAKAGQKGAVQFPDRIQLGVYVYDRGTAYQLGARIRYRVTDGALTLGYRLERPQDVLDLAFQGVCRDVVDRTDRGVWLT